MIHAVSLAEATEVARINAGAYIAGSLALVDAKAYVGHYGAKLICVDMERGEIEYGSKSFSADPVKLAEEIQEELLDVSNWAFILWCRMREIQRRVG